MKNIGIQINANWENKELDVGCSVKSITRPKNVLMYLSGSAALEYLAGDHWNFIPEARLSIEQLRKINNSQVKVEVYRKAKLPAPGLLGFFGKKTNWCLFRVMLLDRPVFVCLCGGKTFAEDWRKVLIDGTNYFELCDYLHSEYINTMYNCGYVDTSEQCRLGDVKLFSFKGFNYNEVGSYMEDLLTNPKHGPKGLT